MHERSEAEKARLAAEYSRLAAAQSKSQERFENGALAGRVRGAQSMILVPEEDAAMDAASARARARGRGREPPGAGESGAGGAEYGATPAQAAALPAHANVPEQTRGALAPGPTGTSTSSATTMTPLTTTRPAGGKEVAAATNTSADVTTGNAGKIQDLEENETPEANMKKSGPVATEDQDNEKDHALGVMPRHGDENHLERRQERTATESTMLDMDAEDEPRVESVPTSSDADTDRQGRRSSDATIMSESEEETEEDVQASEKFSLVEDKKSYVERGGRIDGTLSEHMSGDEAPANGGSAVADGSRCGSKSRSNSGRSAGAPAGPAAIELLDAVLEQETADADAGAGSPAALKFNSPAMSQSTLREVDMASVRTSESTATFASGYSESTEGERTPTESTVKIGFETDSAMMKLLSRGIRIFNLNPKRGIEFIQANDLVHRVPNDDAGNARRIAIFLRHTRGLNKEQIGKVLGGENPQQIAILKYYFVQFDLSEYGPTVRGLERALRSVFECFKPPGESQKIERIVETFADKFNEDNRMIGAEPNPDAEFLPTTTFLLSYSIILLNVDLHNPNNPRKMLRREFISNLRGLDDGKDLPHEALSALYDRMSRHQMRHKVDRDEVAGDLFTHPDKAGWLQKKGPTRLSKWRPRWFILSESTLWYFKHSEDVDPQGFIPLENVLIRTCFDVPAPRGAAAARTSATPMMGVPQVTAATVSTAASTLPSSPMPPRQVASVGGATAAAATLGKASVAATGNASKTSGNFLSATTSASSSTSSSSSSSSSSMLSSSKTCPASPKPLAEDEEKARTGDFHPPTPCVGVGAGAASLFPSGSGATGPASRLARPLSMPLSAVPPDLMYSSEDEASTPGSAKTSSGSGRRLVSRKSATMRFLPGSNPNSPTAAGASSASRQTRSRNFWFEMYMWDDRLNVKSARLSKRTGNFELGQHRTIKLRADSRQEMEQWVELLNRKGRFSQSLQDLTMRARFEQQLHPPRSFAGTPGPKTPNSHAHRKGMHAVSSSPSVPTTPPIAPRLRSSRSSFFRAVFSSSRASSGTDSRPSSPNCMSQPGDLASSEEDLLAVNEHINRASSVASAPTV